MASVTSLRNARDNVTVMYQNVLLQKSRGIKYHIFVENHDDPAYYLHHSTKCGADILKTMVYKCSNKAGVLAIYYKLCHLKQDRKNMMFMVDKDYDGYSNQGYGLEVYSTDFYSIESSMVDDSILRKIWFSCFINTPSKVSVDEFQAGWHTLLNSFVKNFAVDFYTGLIMLHKKGQPYNLDKIKIEDYLETKTKGRVTFKRYKAKQAFEKVSDISLPKLEDSEFKAIYDKNLVAEPRKYAVGKHLLTIFSYYVSAFIKYLESSTEKPSFRCTMQIQIRNPCSNFVYHTDTPKSLEDYIKGRMS